MKKSVLVKNKPLRDDWVAVLPTDTLYGICGSALSKRAVQRIYKLRKRNTAKPMIILIGSFAHLALFGIVLDRSAKALLAPLWPGPVSVVLPLPASTVTEFKYLHRGTRTLAFRMPNDPDVIRLLKKAGPIVAPSANVEGEPVATTIEEAHAYFGDTVDAYVVAASPARMKHAKPSTLISISDGKITVLRPGARVIPKRLLK